MTEIIAAWQALMAARQHTDSLNVMVIWLVSPAGIRALWLCVMSLIVAAVMAAAGLTELAADVSAWRTSRQLRKMR